MTKIMEMTKIIISLNICLLYFRQTIEFEYQNEIKLNSKN